VIRGNDPFYQQLKDLQNSLSVFVSGKGAKGGREMSVRRATLSGQQFLDNDDDDSDTALSGLDDNGQDDSTAIINSMDFVKMKFKTLGFTGKWFDFFGDPAPGFTALVKGSPKFGKSFFCVDFAGYLARHFGKVLYISKEEGINHTLQHKLKRKQVEHPNLEVTQEIPVEEELRRFSFVFLDSVTTLKLTPEDLQLLETSFPQISFIYLHQVTKDGRSRGSNEYSHNVDILVNLPEPGKAVQIGRYGPQAEMDFEINNNPVSLNGLADNENEFEHQRPLFAFATDIHGKQVRIISIEGREVFTGNGVYHASNLFVDGQPLSKLLQAQQ
jgi:hypothetical protein